MRARGFTLLEVMVVLLIIGVTLTFIVPAISTDGPEQVAEREARRVVALARLAREEAILQGKELALEFRPQSYGFAELVGGEWRPLAEDAVLRQRELPREAYMELELGGEAIEPATTTQTTVPRVYFLSSGEMTAFDLVFGVAAVSRRFHVHGGAMGKITLQSQDEWELRTLGHEQ